MNSFWPLCLLALAAVPATAQTAPRVAVPNEKPAFVMGADLSLLQTIEDAGVRYKEAGQPKDPLLIFKNHGVSMVRLRLFVAPDGTQGQVNSLEYTLKLAKRVKAAGLKFYLDFHYSDAWADPGHQSVPSAWKELSHAQLVARVHDYTRDCLADFARAGCLPEVVSVGNEVRAGMMWPDGGPLASEAKWDDFADLLRAGILAVRQNAPRAAVMIHVDSGGDRNACRWFYDHLKSRNVEFDVIGLSYYPFWHGTFADLAANLASLSAAYEKDIYVVETSYDTWGGEQGKLPFPITPAGQKTFLQALIRTVAATPNGHGKGVFYWQPEWIAGKTWHAPQWSGQWENRALFDAQGNALPAISAFETVPTAP